MIRCIAIDDEPLALKQLETYIGKTDFLVEVAACHSAIEAREVLSKETVDVLFCDINMPDLNGMEFVKSLASPPLVVFTTAYSEYAVEGFKVDAVDYLLKPFGLDDFLKAALKVKKRYELEHRMESEVSLQDDCLFFKTDYKMVRVAIAKIVHVEGMSEYLKIYKEGERQPVIVLMSMKKLEERLPREHFLRVHKSFIVNLDRIAELTKGHVTMENGTSIPVGDLYREALNDYVDRKFLSR